MKILFIDSPPLRVKGALLNLFRLFYCFQRQHLRSNQCHWWSAPRWAAQLCNFEFCSNIAKKYAVVFPNYQGSIGFGQASVDSLLTRIGHVDVDDVVTNMKYFVVTFADLGCRKIGICGGSHGGFLTAHCTSQYPGFFKAGAGFFRFIILCLACRLSIFFVAACRNPVTNIALIYSLPRILVFC
jgi:hypothetical protein